MDLFIQIEKQQRHSAYTKNQLRTIFAYDDVGVEKFIKSLKSYGILKTVANTVEQKELTDLVDEDVQVMDETVGNDDCYYVFTYAKNVISYMTTRFFRFLVLIKKNTQNAPRGVYEFVPVQDFSKP